ncbi:MAG: SDR family NAD(P)-dependent oxidoreductase [Spirochaetes bacterium]|nr:SDR family NAD(P)-dependent oxidoreductase [Spirochaetota bacterium]
MNYFQDKNVLITGAAGGFGVEFIRQLLPLGTRLLLADINGPALEEKVSSVMSSIPGVAGRVVKTIESDLSTAGGCEALYRSCDIPVDILINNAGMLTYGFFHEHPADALDRLMAVNMLAPMRLSRLFLPDMVARRGGHIVFISSLAAAVPTALETSYSASKCGVRGLGMALSAEVKKFGVAVTNVYPNFADTGMLNTGSFGSATVRRVSPFMIGSPAMIVRSALRGIGRKKLNVYPGVLTKAISLWAGISSMVYTLSADEQ